MKEKPPNGQEFGQDTWLSILSGKESSPKLEYIWPHGSDKWLVCLQEPGMKKIGRSWQRHVHGHVGEVGRVWGDSYLCVCVHGELHLRKAM